MPRRGKDDAAEPDVCPPHHWEVTNVRIDGVSYYHHSCFRCHAQKDTPVIPPETPSNWKSRTHAPKRKPPVAVESGAT